MRLRMPLAAGHFYPRDRAECRQLLEEMAAGLSPVPAAGAIAPHAGWIYSGRTAMRSIISISAFHPDTVVLFGAVHVAMRAEAAAFCDGAWLTPLGEVAVDGELAGLVNRIPQVRDDSDAHLFEHSIEVLVPLVQRCLPDARILPLMVAPSAAAEQIGRECAKAVVVLGRRVGYVASTDLTHYGPAFGIEPAGHGDAGIKWAHEVNDRRLIDLICTGQASAVVREAAINRNACGAGAIAAVLGAMSEVGAVRFQELEHTWSAAIERAAGAASPANSVGYLAGVFL